jgi:hypothetical protein
VPVKTSLEGVAATPLPPPFADNIDTSTKHTRVPPLISLLGLRVLAEGQRVPRRNVQWLQPTVHSPHWCVGAAGAGGGSVGASSPTRRVL